MKTTLPSLFNDTYSEKNFEKKILSKLFVPADKQFVLDLYTKTEDGMYTPKTDITLSKKDIKKLKLLVKQIRKQKGRIKFVPLFVTVGLIAVLVCGVAFFKNPLLKRVMTSAMEDAFGAKCDIASVDLRIFDSRLAVTELAVANKDQPMKNLFELSDIVVDFDLVQLLKGRFVMDEITANGIQLGTERTVSGALEQKPKKEKIESSAENAETQSAVSMKEQIASLVQEKTTNATDGVTQLFSSFEPQAIIDNFYGQMQSPKIIESLQPQAESLVTSWQTTSADLTASVTSFTTKAQSLAQTDIASIQDPASLASLLKNADSVLKDAENIKASVENAAAKIKTDAASVQQISLDMQNAVQSDMNLVNTQIAQISNLNISDAARLFSGELDQPAMQLLAKYVPIAEMALAKAKEFQTSGAKKAEKPKAKTGYRSSGRTLEYRKDTIPDILIRTVNLSGKDEARQFALSGVLHNISNDCDKLGKPIDAEFVLNRNASNTEKLNAVLDLRTNRTAKAFVAELTGNGYAVNNLTVPNAADSAGIPYVSGLASFTAKTAFDTDSSFDLEAALKLTQAVVSVKPFEPAFAYSMYSRAIEPIKELNVSAIAGYTVQDLLKMNIWTDVDSLLANSLKAIFDQEIASVRKQIEQTAKEEIEKITGPLEDQLALFNSIKGIVNGDTSSYASMQTQIEAKKAEIEQRIKAQTDAATGDAVKQITDQIPSDAIDNLNNLKKLF